MAMTNQIEALNTQLHEYQPALMYSEEGNLGRFLSLRQRRRYHEEQSQRLMGRSVNIRIFDLPDFHVFSVVVLGEPFYGRGLLDVLTLASPRTPGEEVSQQSKSGVLNDWIIPDKPENNQILLHLHQRLKKKWDDFIWGDRYQFMKSLSLNETFLPDIYKRILAKHEDVEAEMVPHLMWATSKDDGERFYLMSGIPASLTGNLDSRFNRRLGLILATALSPLQRDALPTNIALEKDGRKQPMREAQLPLLVDMFDTLLLRSDLFRNIEKSTGLVAPSLLKPPTLSQLVRQQIEDGKYFFNRFKRKTLPHIVAASCGLGMLVGAIVAVGGAVEGIYGAYSINNELNNSYPRLNGEDNNQNLSEAASLLKDYQDLLKGSSSEGQDDVEQRAEKVEVVKNKLEAPVLRGQLQDQLWSKRLIDIKEIKVDRALVSIFGGLVLAVGSFIGGFVYEERRSR